MSEQLTIEDTQPTPELRVLKLSGALVNAQVSHTRNGRKLALQGVNTRVTEVLKITRVDNLFTFLPAEASAAGTNS